MSRTKEIEAMLTSLVARLEADLPEQPAEVRNIVELARTNPIVTDGLRTFIGKIVDSNRDAFNAGIRTSLDGLEVCVRVASKGGGAAPLTAFVRLVREVQELNLREDQQAWEGGEAAPSTEVPTEVPTEPEIAAVDVELKVVERFEDDGSRTYRVVETDNFGRDYPNESFALKEELSFTQACLIADVLNASAGGEYAPRCWKVVGRNYKLEPWFEP